MSELDRVSSETESVLSPGAPGLQRLCHRVLVLSQHWSQSPERPGLIGEEEEPYSWAVSYWDSAVPDLTSCWLPLLHPELDILMSDKLPDLLLYLAF